MALKHAGPCEVVDVKPLGSSLAATKTSTLFKTEHVELIRIVMLTGKEITEHAAPGEIIVHCLEGRIAFTANGTITELGAGQVLYLPAGVTHAVRCVEDASFLLTILAKR